MTEDPRLEAACIGWYGSAERWTTASPTIQATVRRKMAAAFAAADAARPPRPYDDKAPWHPIRHAPKDRRVRLLAPSAGDLWVIGEGQWSPGGFWVWAGNASYMPMAGSPTHWQEIEDGPRSAG